MPADNLPLAGNRDEAKAAAHTPGTLPPEPWFVDPDDRPGMEWNNHVLSADGHTICFMAHNPDDNTALENAARLIAAAPDLLEALKAMCVSHENLYRSVFGELSDPQADIIRKEAEAAIQRAGSAQ